MPPCRRLLSRAFGKGERVMEYLRVKNWEQFQHYKDRSPSWIKLHKSILDNYEYQCLPLASRALAPMLWLLASEYEEGKIPADLNRIAFRVRVSVSDLQDALNPLISSGFFIGYQDASTMLAECLPREREEKSKREKELTPSANAADPCPHQEIIQLYHDHLPMMPVVREWNASRQTKLRARWKEKADRQSLDWWAQFFAYVAESDFLCGRTAKPFVCNLEWLITPTNFAKVIEGNYENRGVAA